MAADPQRINPFMSGYPGSCGASGSGSSYLHLANTGGNDGLDVGGWGNNVIPLGAPQCYNRVDVYTDDTNITEIRAVGRFHAHGDAGFENEYVWLPLRTVEDLDATNVADSDYATAPVSAASVTQDDTGDTALLPCGSFYLDGATQVAVLSTTGGSAGRNLYVKLSTGS